MKLKYDKLLSTFAFDFNLRRYRWDCFGTGAMTCLECDDRGCCVCSTACHGKECFWVSHATFVSAADSHL